MSYIGIDINENSIPFIEKKSPLDYPESVKHEVHLLTFKPDQPPFFMGTYSRRFAGKYPGDIDLMETFFDCCTVQDVAEKFEKTLIEVVHNIINTPNHYVSEFKAGLDKRYSIDTGKLDNGRYTPNNSLFQIATIYFKKGLLTKKEYVIIRKLLNSPNLGGDAYDIINNIFREHKILRWSVEEIFQGSKMLPGNKQIKLSQALTHRTPVKIDMLAPLNGKFIEITNFFLLATNENGKLHSINLEYDITKESYLEEALSKLLPLDIDKLYYSNAFYSPFKMIKRLYTLAIQSENEVLLNQLVPILGSSISMLYQIKSEIDTLVVVIETAHDAPMDMINHQLDELKSRFATIIEIQDKQLKEIELLLNEIINQNQPDAKIELLKQLKKMIVPILNNYTIKYLEKVGLNPPPTFYLPAEISYARITRTPDDNPMNPLKVLGGCSSCGKQ
jgi:hypothetical protein